MNISGKEICDLIFRVRESLVILTNPECLNHDYFLNRKHGDSFFEEQTNSLSKKNSCLNIRIAVCTL